MPREPWRDDPQYLALWRASRQQPDDPGPSLVLSDWLEENGHLDAVWRARLRGLSGREPEIDDDIARPGYVPIGQGAWQMLLAAPPPDRLLVLFPCNVQAYQYIRRFSGRCGWDMGTRDWPSETEREHLLAIPRLVMLACKLMTLSSWEWTTKNLTELTHLELNGPWLEAEHLGALRRLPGLCHLTLLGRAAHNTRAVTTLPGLRHLSLGPYTYNADRIEELAPNAESLRMDLEELGEAVRWPGLRSFCMLHYRGAPLLGESELSGLARYPLLERLNVRCDGLETAALEALATAPRLRDLTLRNEGAPVTSLEALSGCPSLESLTIDSPIDETCLVQIGKLSGLRCLNLPRVRLGMRGTEALTQLRLLESLTLSGEFTDEHPPLALAELPSLERLDLRSLEMPPEFAHAIRDAVPFWVEYPLPEA